jgi:hypothetical protein
MLSKPSKDRITIYTFLNRELMKYPKGGDVNSILTQVNSLHIVTFLFQAIKKLENDQVKTQVECERTDRLLTANLTSKVSLA